MTPEVSQHPRLRTMHFCVVCFASNEDGSWGCTTVPEANFCGNCSSNDCLVAIPFWAVESIRQQASWVGKRYYPCDEDRSK